MLVRTRERTSGSGNRHRPPASQTKGAPSIPKCSKAVSAPQGSPPGRNRGAPEKLFVLGQDANAPLSKHNGKMRPSATSSTASGTHPTRIIGLSAAHSEPRSGPDRQSSHPASFRQCKRAEVSQPLGVQYGNALLFHRKGLVCLLWCSLLPLRLGLLGLQLAAR